VVRAAVKTSDLAELLEPGWYCATNQDVARSDIVPSEHYRNWGIREGRMPCEEADLIRSLGLLDSMTVAVTMPDVIAAGADPVRHYCTFGWRERRRPNPYFDTGWYLDTHDIPAGMNPLLHYVLFGENQGLRPSQHFDPAWYRTCYGIRPPVVALAHYMQHRCTQRFSPVPNFDVQNDVEAYRETLLPNRDPYAHFLAHGSLIVSASDQPDAVAA
jgi:hypothetical protein